MTERGRRAAGRPVRRLGLFVGPWESGHLAKDGAVLSFGNVERAVSSACAAAGIDCVPLDPLLFVASDPASRLAGLDVIYANCGPLAALLLAWRERHGLSFRLVREVRTTGWIGYAFQEEVAASLARAGDACVHSSAYARDLWRRFRGESGDVHLQPVVSRRRRTRPLPRRPLVTGYLSRVCRGKGFAALPAVLEHLRAHGWPLAGLRTCGEQTDPGLVAGVAAAVTRQGLAFEHRGPLSHADALALLEAVDVVVFPTLSSFESAGRVSIEAAAAGKVVIGTDYCANAELIGRQARIPFAPDSGQAGPSHREFEVARLDLERWTPPAPDEAAASMLRVSTRYTAHPATLTALITGRVAPLARPDTPLAPVPGLDLELDRRLATATDRDALVEELLARLRAARPSRTQLVDLGGAAKQALLAAGYCPQARFTVRSARDNGEPGRRTPRRA